MQVKAQRYVSSSMLWQVMFHIYNERLYTQTRTHTLSCHSLYTFTERVHTSDGRCEIRWACLKQKSRRYSSWNSPSPGCLPSLSGADTATTTDGERTTERKGIWTLPSLTCPCAILWYNCWHHSSWSFLQPQQTCVICKNLQHMITSHTSKRK